jgi:hypothetical protein
VATAESAATDVVVASSNPTPPGPSLPAAVSGLVSVVIDDEDMTNCVESGSVTRTLNRAAQATLRVYSDCSGNTGNGCSKVKVYIGDTLYFHGMVTQISTEAREDGAIVSEFTCQDPMFLWQWRPARDGPYGASLDPYNPGIADTGDFSKPSFMFIGYAPQIMYEILTQSMIEGVPADAEGTLFTEIGYVAGGITDVTGMPVDWPMTIAEIFELLASTGILDCVMTPIDSGGNMARLDIYNGDYGVNRTSSVSLDYATGDMNVSQVRMIEDSSNICNKLWYYLGPRVQTAKDPAGDQHWKANITADDNVVEGYTGYAEMISQRDDSRENCGVRMEVRIYDGTEEDAPSGYRELYRRLWFMEQWLRLRTRTLVHMKPVRTSEAMMLPPGVVPVQVGDFDIGDLISVNAGSIIRGGFSGAQRVYGYTVNFDEDGVLDMGEIMTSADAEGLG